MAGKLSDAIIKRLARAALEKRRVGRAPTAREAAALRQVEAEQEEKRRWQYYETVPAAHYRDLAGCTAKELKTQAHRFGLPLHGRSINLREAIKALHDNLAGRLAQTVQSMSAVAEHFDVAERTVKDWLSRGMPRTVGGRDGKRIVYRYDLDAIAKWREQSLQPYQQAPNGAEGPRNRLDRLRADGLEFRLAKQRGEVVEVDPVRRLIERRINEAKALLGQLADRIAAELVGVAEQDAIDRVHEIIIQQIAAAYRSLADMARAEEVGGDVDEDET